MVPHKTCANPDRDVDMTWRALTRMLSAVQTVTALLVFFSIVIRADSDGEVPPKPSAEAVGVNESSIGQLRGLHQ